MVRAEIVEISSAEQANERARWVVLLTFWVTFPHDEPARRLRHPRATDQQ